MGDEKDKMIDHLISLVEKVTDALGQHKSYIELQNKDMAVQHTILKEASDSISIMKADIKTVLDDIKDVKEKDKSLRRLLIWASTISLTVGGAIGTFLSYLAKMAK